MSTRYHHPAYALHAVVARLDRLADAILEEHFSISYPRFLTLLTVERLGEATQRELATELGVSEPAVSRTVATLSAQGWLTATATPGSGNRRRVTLTDTAQQLVEEGAATLEAAFASLLEQAGLTPSDVLDVTTPLLSVTEETS